MAPPIALDTFAVDLLGTSPALGGAENDHWPGRPARSAALAMITLYFGNAVQASLECGGELLVHGGWVITRNDIRLVTVSPHQIQQLIGGNAGQNGGIRNLVPVEMQDRQHRSITDWIQELVGVPRGRKRTGLGFAVADDACNDQVWVVKGCTVRVRDRVAEFAAFMDGPRSLRSDVARDSAGKRELRKEPLHAMRIAGDVGIDLRVSALQPCRGHERGAAVARTNDVDHVEIALANGAIEVRVKEVEARRRAPVSEQPWFDMLGH